MPKVSSKENKNIYFQRREKMGLTREKASELLEVITPERIEKIENERCEPHPEEVLLMSEKYKAPEMCNYYCAHQCPIGMQYIPEIKVQDLSQIVLKMLASFNEIEESQKKLIQITQDGVISDDEVEDFVKIQSKLEKLSMAVDSMQLWSEQMLADGRIDSNKYRGLLEKYR